MISLDLLDEEISKVARKADALGIHCAHLQAEIDQKQREYDEAAEREDEAIAELEALREKRRAELDSGQGVLL